MKIAILSRYFPKDCIGGGENYIYEVWKRAKDDFDVELISGWKHNPNLLPKNTKKIHLSSKNVFMNYYKYYTQSKKYLKKINPDLVQSICYEFPTLKKPNVITVCHLGHLMGKVGNNSLKIRLQKKLTVARFNQANRLIAISQSTKNDLMKLGIPEDKISMDYTGINIEKYSIKKTNNDKFTIVYPSRISREKGQDIAIKAYNKLPPEIRKNCKLQIVGFVTDDDYLSSLKKMSDENVEILTNVPKIEYYIMNADLILFPTLMWEGFGIVAGEALACEKPLISSDFPAVREACGKYGLWIKPGDIDSLAKKIEMIYSDPKLRNKISKGGREWIKNNFSWDQIYKNHKKVWESLF